MNPSAVPARITIDFRDAIHPSRTWILGLGDDVAGRADLLAFEAPSTPSRGTTSATTPRTHPTAAVADCSCPEFCERDHANE